MRYRDGDRGREGHSGGDKKRRILETWPGREKYLYRARIMSYRKILTATWCNIILRTQIQHLRFVPAALTKDRRWQRTARVCIEPSSTKQPPRATVLCGAVEAERPSYD